MKTELIITSPTGREIRNDSEGLGYYKAPRGNKKHQGYDFLCTPGQDVVCPIESGKIVRVAYPYQDKVFSGMLIEGRHISIKLFYCNPCADIIRKWVVRNDVIATAQDISKRYGKATAPHVHLEIVAVDPEILLEENY